MHGFGYLSEGTLWFWLVCNVEVAVEVADMGAETGDVGVGEGLCFGKFVCMDMWYACSCSA